MTDPKTALLAAIDAAESQTALASKLTEHLKGHPWPQMRTRVVTQATVARWVQRGRAANDMCMLIEDITGVRAVDLRPDTFSGANT